MKTRRSAKEKRLIVDSFEIVGYSVMNWKRKMTIEEKLEEMDKSDRRKSRKTWRKRDSFENVRYFITNSKRKMEKRENFKETDETDDWDLRKIWRRIRWYDSSEGNSHKIHRMVNGGDWTFNGPAGLNTNAIINDNFLEAGFSATMTNRRVDCATKIQKGDRCVGILSTDA